MNSFPSKRAVNQVPRCRVERVSLTITHRSRFCTALVAAFFATSNMLLIASSVLLPVLKPNSSGERRFSAVAKELFRRAKINHSSVLTVVLNSLNGRKLEGFSNGFPGPLWIRTSLASFHATGNDDCRMQVL